MVPAIAGRSGGRSVVTGMRGIRVVPESKERDRLAFAFMSNGISSERQVETAVRQTAALIEQVRLGRTKDRRGGRAGGGPYRRRRASVPDDTARTCGCTSWRECPGVHDIEAALLGTSLGMRQGDGRQAEHGHRNHMRAINAIYHAGGIRGAVESGRLTKVGCSMNVCGRRFLVLAGSLRDDGPMPDTITDMNVAQDAYAEQLKGAGLVLCLGSMLHSIAVGNMLPSWVKDRVRGY